MSAIPVNLPDDLRAKAEARAAAAGRADVADYIRALVEEDVAGEVFRAPPHLSPRTPAEADALIREGLGSPTRPMTADDWNEIRRRVEDGVTRGGQG
jgi:plasmid stability protein